MGADRLGVPSNLRDSYQLLSRGVRPPFFENVDGTTETVDRMSVFGEWLHNMWRGALPEAKHWPIVRTWKPASFATALAGWRVRATAKIIYPGSGVVYKGCLGTIIAVSPQLCIAWDGKRKLRNAGVEGVLEQIE